jgi:tripartite-type tricarboxylate transporter receptor subunit TctC
MLIRRLFMTLAAGAPLLLGADAALAADDAYPTRPVTMVVPYAAGGPTDTVARLVAESMSGTLGQQVIVENVAGAGGTLGAGRVAEAEPDGYTLLLHHIGLATAPALYRKLRFDPLRDFAPIGLVTEAPMTLVSRPDLPAETAAEVLDWVRERKDQVTYANAGLGGGSHICGMLLMSALDTQMTTVPYKGTGPAMTDLMGSQVDLMCDQATNTVGPIKGGQIKAFAVTSRERIPALPDLPTLDEAGLKGFEVTIWHGLYAPAGTPQPVVERLATALQTAVQDQKVLARFGDIATTPVPADRATPAVLGEVLAAEVARWRPIIEAAGVYAD